MTLAMVLATLADQGALQFYFSLGEFDESFSEQIVRRRIPLRDCRFAEVLECNNTFYAQIIRQDVDCAGSWSFYRQPGFHGLPTLSSVDLGTIVVIAIIEITSWFNIYELTGRFILNLLP